MDGFFGVDAVGLIRFYLRHPRLNDVGGGAGNDFYRIILGRMIKRWPGFFGADAFGLIRFSLRHPRLNDVGGGAGNDFDRIILDRMINRSPGFLERMLLV